jgi:hypothetical protein
LKVSWLASCRNCLVKSAFARTIERVPMHLSQLKKGKVLQRDFH